MNTKNKAIQKTKLIILTVTILVFTQCTNKGNSIIIDEQGSFTVGGSVITVNRNKKCSDFGKKNYSGNGNSLCSNFGNNSAVTVVLN